MPVEIGSLVVRATFGTGTSREGAEAQLREEIARLRQDLLDEVQEMIAEAERRSRDR
jgi:hypothetical protein